VLEKHQRGEKHWNAKLTEKGVKGIKVLIKEFIPLKGIEDKYDVSIATISLIKLGKTWKHKE